MNFCTLVDTGYLPAVMSSRSLAAERADRVAELLRTPAVTLGFLLNFLELRTEQLQIPRWLQASASACEASHPEVAAELREAAAIERLHQRALITDLGEIYALLGDAEVSPVSDPRIDRHVRMRALVPTRDEPLIVLAIDLELAVLGSELGPALLDTSARSLGSSVDARRFLRARSANVLQRIQAREARLGAVLLHYPERARSWAKVASDLVLSYLDALDACAEHGEVLARVA